MFSLNLIGVNPDDQMISLYQFIELQALFAV